MPVRSSLALLAAVLLGSVLLGGCEEDPSVLRTDLAFTLYGYLDPTADRQAIRVVPIAPTIGADTSRTLDATVVSSEQGSGRTVTWRDSVVTYADGSIGHVFVADYTPTPGETVTFAVTEAQGADPRTASVEVMIPPISQSTLLPAASSGAQVTYPIQVLGVPNVLGGALRLYVTGFPGAPADTTVLTVTDVDLDIRDIGSDNWRIDIPFFSATRTYLQQQNLLNTLTLIAAEFGTFVANDAWAVPPGGFDLDAIVEPGTFSNVAGGFGFVGAGYEAPVRWTPSIATQSRAGFLVSGDPASFVTINEVSLTDGWIEIYNPIAEPVEVGAYTLTLGPVNTNREIPGPATIEANGFLVVETDLTFAVEDRVALLNPSGNEVTFTFVASDEGSSFGSFPDGRSLQLPRGGPNLFKGPLIPTRGGPNEVTYVPAVINEVFTAGVNGWAEVYTLTDQNASYVLSHDPEMILGGVAARLEDPTHAFLSAEEAGGAFELQQTGGEVYLLARSIVGLEDPPPDEEFFRVVDYRVYGPQDPTRSIGRLPDGPDGEWREGLVPTRGQPNSPTGRLGAW